METNNLMQLVLIGILLLCGYVYLFQVVATRAVNKAAIPLLAIVLLLVYAIVMIPIMYIINSVGSTEYTLLMALILISCIVLFAAVYGLIHNFRSISKKSLLLFLVYVFAVGYITIFSRDGESNDTSVLVSFDSIQTALDTRSFEPLEHLWLNIAMFVPMGFLFPFIDPDRLNSLSLIVPIGLVASTAIETVQLFLAIGQCDVEDLVGNTLGAVLGVLAYRIYRRVRPPES